MAGLNKLISTALLQSFDPGSMGLKRKYNAYNRSVRKLFTRHGWVHCGARQQARYAKNKMDEQQRNSHKPGTVQPKHIFG